jgi:hypothetical protein
MGDLDSAAAVYLDPNVKDSDARKPGYTAKKVESLSLVLVSDQCYKTPIVPIGTHVISLMQKGDLQINLGYLLYW